MTESTLPDPVSKTSSIRRAVQVMDILARKGPLGVRALAKEAGLPAASALRILADLAAEAVVEQHEGDWSLSYRLLEIGGLQLDNIEIPKLARPFCERIAEATGETVNIVMLSGHNAVCVDKVRGDTGMQLDWRVGTRGPLHCGGSAKAILAFSPEALQADILAGPMPALTEHTLTTPEALATELERTRQRGYSIDDQEVVLGVWCVAVPMLDRAGNAVGAISVTGPSKKQPGRSVATLKRQLDEVCSLISRQLGYAGDWLA
ncbi:MAG: IclR family transcriptional regulator [Devosia sp.]|nr:IclR family transcriptional regulator [Devosia sp.]